MNLLIFRPGEWEQPLSPDDIRCLHIKTILNINPGDILAAGELGGHLGKAVLREARKDGSLVFDFHPEKEAPPLCSLNLVIGMPRPPTAKRLIRDLTAAGVARILFTGTDLGEKSYLGSRLWRKEEWKEAVLTGLAQGKSTLPPAVEKYYSLYRAMDSLDSKSGLLALDNKSPQKTLKKALAGGMPPGKKTEGITLALGPERGWSDRERALLKDRGFGLCSLGSRVLRTETAVHMSCALAMGALNFI